MRTTYPSRWTGPVALVSGTILLALTFLAAGCGSDNATKDELSTLNPPHATASPSSESAATPEPTSTDSDDAVTVGPERPADRAASADRATPGAGSDANVADAAPVSWGAVEATWNAGDYKEVSEQCIRFTQENPENRWGFYLLGLSLRQTGDLEGAASALVRATELDPRYAKAWLNLARVYLDAQQPDTALTAIDRARELDPGSGVAQRLAGRAYQQLGRVSDAANAYRNAIAANPQDVWAMNNLGFLWIEQDQCDQALPALARACELHGEVAMFRNNLGMALERMGYIRDAEAAYRAAANAGSEKAADNVGRIERVESDPGEGHADLAALADAFARSIAVADATGQSMEVTRRGPANGEPVADTEGTVVGTRAADAAAGIDSAHVDPKR